MGRPTLLEKPITYKMHNVITLGQTQTDKINNIIAITK